MNEAPRDGNFTLMMAYLMLDKGACVSESYAGGRTTAGTGSHAGQISSELPYKVTWSSRLGTRAWH